MDQKISLRTLQQMKNEGRKIVGVVAWDYQIARIVDRAGVDIVLRRGHRRRHRGALEPVRGHHGGDARRREGGAARVSRALVSVDFPFGPLQEGAASAVSAAIRFVKEAGVDMVKLDAGSTTWTPSRR